MNAAAPDRLHETARQLLLSPPPRPAFEALARGETGLDEVLARIQARIAWLGQFGELITLCGLPPEDGRQRDLPLASIAIPRLLEVFEQGLTEDTPLPDTPAVLSGLLLKAATLRGKSARTPQLEAWFERWAATVLPDPEGQPLPPAGAVTAPDILLAWLERWGFEGCEYTVLHALDQARPASLAGSQRERLEALARKLPGRVGLPQRDLPYLPARLRPNASRDSLRDEIDADLMRQSPLPAYLLRRWEANERGQDTALPTGAGHAEILRDLLAHLAARLATSAQDIAIETLRTDLGGQLQDGRQWLSLRPTRAEANGLVGARVWLDFQLRDQAGQYQEAAWNIYLGADPAGLGLKAFLDLAEAIRNEHEPILPALARDLHECVRQHMAEANQRLRRATLAQPGEGAHRSPPV